MLTFFVFAVESHYKLILCDGVAASRKKLSTGNSFRVMPLTPCPLSRLEMKKGEGVHIRKLNYTEALSFPPILMGEAPDRRSQCRAPTGGRKSARPAQSAGEGNIFFVDINIC